MYENENKYNNLLDKDGFEINPGIVQDCVVWLVGGAVRSDYTDWEKDNDIDSKPPKREHLTFFARITLWGSEKPTVLSYDIPEEYHNDIDEAMRWGVNQLVDNFRMKIDEQVNKLIEENGQSNTIERL